MDKQELIEKIERAKRVRIKHEMDLANINLRIEKYERQLEKIEMFENIFSK